MNILQNSRRVGLLAVAGLALLLCGCRRDLPEQDPVTEVNKPRPTNIVESGETQKR